MSASGTVGGTITFDKRGFVRQRVIPANPQSDLQGNVRQMLLGVQKALSRIGATVIAAVKSVAPVSYRWNAYLLQLSIGPNSAEFEASKTAYAAMSAPERTAWDAAAVALGLTEQSIVYATDAPISAGLALFAVSRALWSRPECRRRNSCRWQ
jgi:hypothetical protein